jgi:predicted acyltransferase (DUF342 family)
LGIVLLFFSILAFLAVFGLPLLPGLLEILRPADSGALVLDRRYARTPNYFAESFRHRVSEALAHVNGDARVPFLRRKSEYARLEKDFVVASGVQQRDVIVASGRVLVNDGARLTDVVAEGDLFIGNDVEARSLVSAKSLHIGSRCSIGRWAHADGDLVVGGESHAGASLTASGSLSLHGDVRFARAFGMPIRAVGARTSSVQAVPRKAQIIPSGSTVREEVICRGDVWIGERCTILGSVKAHGSLMVGAESRVEGNVVARKAIVIGAGAAILGHVFSEEAVTLGPKVIVGAEHAHKSVHGGGGVRLGNGAIVWGAIINDPGRAGYKAVATG